MYSIGDSLVTRDIAVYFDVTQSTETNKNAFSLPCESEESPSKASVTEVVWTLILVKNTRKLHDTDIVYMIHLVMIHSYC